MAIPRSGNGGMRAGEGSTLEACIPAKEGDENSISK